MIGKNEYIGLALLMTGCLILAGCKKVETSINEEPYSTEYEKNSGIYGTYDDKTSNEPELSSITDIKAPDENLSDTKEEDAFHEGTIEESNSTKTDTPDKNACCLRDCVYGYMGSRIGCAVTLDELSDDKVWEIITSHFERVTFGNELKPDALVGYSCSTCPGTETVFLNGEELTVPVLDFSRAEKMLDRFYEWNKANPDRQIRIRGHVLLWHAQTPEWFFHEDYDKSKDYVTSDVMDKRLEWYIKTVLEHFTGPDSKYNGMFYGWDVVNEAIGDGTGELRTDAENPSESLDLDRHSSNSSWYHIYQNNEFILNAFMFANKYAPADLELYYNDYNECSLTKRNGIINLLSSIKEAEGPPGEGTRIDAFGMQGHYGMESPSANDIEASIKLYSKVVDAIQITELDISASPEFDGSETSAKDENEKLKKRYNLIYYTLTGLNKRNDISITGITFWGTTDKYSWLQNRSDIGGGNKNGQKQMPLLFDFDYNAKPCFDVFTKTK